MAICVECRSIYFPRQGFIHIGCPECTAMIQQREREEITNAETGREQEDINQSEDNSVWRARNYRKQTNESYNKVNATISQGINYMLGLFRNRTQ